MISRVVRYTTSKPKRVIVVWLIAALALATVGGLKSFEVTTDDTAQFLPKSSESAEATRYAQQAFGVEKGTHTVTVLVKRSDGRPLAAADRSHIGDLAAAMPAWRADTAPLKDMASGTDVRKRAGSIAAVALGPVAKDGRFQLVALRWKANSTDPVAQDAFRQFRDQTADRAAAQHLEAGFTGGVASVADDTEANESSRALGQALLFGSVLLFSLLFFRGPLAAVVPLLTIVIVAQAASGLVILSALAFGFKLDVGTPQTIAVVLIGIGVDYFLFLLFRLRERLRAGDETRKAAAAAAGSVGPVIASAALVVVAAFATLGLAEFGQFRVLGPAIAISVLVMLLAGITLMPAVAAVTGRKLFWPSKSWRKVRTGGPAARLGRLIAARSGRIALGVTVVLLALGSVAVGTRMNYDLSSDGRTTAATRTADEIAASLPKGAGDPQQVYVKSERPLTRADLDPMRSRLAKLDGVGSVGAPVLTPDRRGARIELALNSKPTEKAATELVRGSLRTTVRETAPSGSTALVAGNAAVYADVAESVDHDLKLILPVAAGLILLILVATLRSVVAPLYLLAAVALEFAATLGAAVLVFQQIGAEPGIAFTLPLVVFLFVVALGTDYNILMTARLREEMLAGKTVRAAVADAVRHVAPAIAAAGLVLASSFGTLMLEADSASKQLGFTMAFGILLASMVVSTLLVPALTALVGRRAWSDRKPRAARPRRKEAVTA
jgi:RND superfamily putative drug exporter